MERGHFRVHGARDKAVLLLAFSLTLASCGPSLEEQEKAREADRLRGVAASEQALATFAKSHGAMPGEILESDLAKRSFTAQLARQA